jgi:hypothetical protein
MMLGTRTALSSGHHEPHSSISDSAFCNNLPSHLQQQNAFKLKSDSGPQSIQVNPEVVLGLQKLKECLVCSGLKDYEIGALLGRGGFGYVYEARSKLNAFRHLDLAVKMVRGTVGSGSAEILIPTVVLDR